MVQLVSVEKLPSPLIPNFLRISAEVRFESGELQTVWFDFPTQFEPYVNDRGEPWLVLLLPCAIVAGEDITLDLPVDPTLLYNLKGVQRVWQSWYPWMKLIKMEVPELRNPVVGTENLLFFTGGVDSYFSLLGAHSKSEDTANALVSTLLMVWGFDIPLSSPDEFARARQLGEQAAKQFNKQFIPIATNLRELNGFGRWYGELSHGAALAGIGHLFSNKFQNILIASTHDYSHLSPWGSHPLVDPQFSSAQTRIIHDGAASTRVEKMERLCSVPETTKAVRVCYALNSASNCCQCSKCLRAMVTFDLLDKQHLAESFDWSDYSLDRVANVFLMNKNDTDFFQEIREAAQQRDRLDIVRAINRSLKRSKRLRPILNNVGKTPFFWRYEDLLRRALIKRR